MRKRKKKSKLPKQEKPPIDFELFFDDITLLQTNGEYRKVKAIMDGAEVSIPPPKRFLHGSVADMRYYSPSTDWCIKSRLTIFSPLGEGQYLLDFYHDKKVFIVGYGGMMDPMQNADIRCLSVWCQTNGWNIPQVLPMLARDNLPFWKTLWETTLIDSDFFDEKYGARRATAMRTLAEAEVEDEELL